MFSKVWAQKFNEAKPPKPIDYIDCFVLELVDRPGRPLTGCELYLPGTFSKKNNNVGATVTPSKDDSKVDIDIAQAFSHFSFEKSNQALLICDIQGVGNSYTDPQIHTQNGEGFGGGNLGMTGIRAFMLRHSCTDVCKQMGLQPMVAKDVPDEGQAKLASGGSSAHDVSSRLAASSYSHVHAVPSSASKHTAAVPAKETASPGPTLVSNRKPPSSQKDDVFDGIMGRSHKTVKDNSPTFMGAAETALMKHLDGLDID